MTIEERLWQHIEPEPNSGCWLWMASGTLLGYGQITIEGKRYLAHRLMYELTHREKLHTRGLDHLCRVPSCVNPKHLEPVTQRENVLRGYGLTSQNAKKTMCLRGHPFTEQNTYLQRGVYGPLRVCRTCHREKVARQRYARRMKDTAHARRSDSI